MGVIDDIPILDAPRSVFAFERDPADIEAISRLTRFCQWFVYGVHEWINQRPMDVADVATLAANYACGLEPDAGFTGAPFESRERDDLLRRVFGEAMRKVDNETVMALRKTLRHLDRTRRIYVVVRREGDHASRAA